MKAGGHEIKICKARCYTCYISFYLGCLFYIFKRIEYNLSYRSKFILILKLKNFKKLFFRLLKQLLYRSVIHVACIFDLLRCPYKSSQKSFFAYDSRIFLYIYRCCLRCKQIPDKLHVRYLGRKIFLS